MTVFGNTWTIGCLGSYKISGLALRVTGQLCNYQPIKIKLSLIGWQFTFAGLVEILKTLWRVYRWARAGTELLDLNSSYRRGDISDLGWIAFRFAVFDLLRDSPAVKARRKHSLLYQGGIQMPGECDKNWIGIVKYINKSFSDKRYLGVHSNNLGARIWSDQSINVKIIKYFWKSWIYIDEDFKYDGGFGFHFARGLDICH